jgi:AcrR family transcriptional regulator
VSRRRPVQRRSRERVEQILQAAVELLSERGVEGLTMRTLAARSEIPVATIYRYFANRDELIGAYLEQELQQIERSALLAVSQVDRVTVRSMVELIALSHMRHHQTHPEGVQVWFGGRSNPAVLDQIRLLDARLAASFRAVTLATGMLEPGAPEFHAELLVRLFDRVFEFIFAAQRTAREQRTIVLSFVDMIACHLERSATRAGVEGIPAEEFVKALVAGPAAESRPRARSDRRA